MQNFKSVILSLLFLSIFCAHNLIAQEKDISLKNEMTESDCVFDVYFINEYGLGYTIFSNSGSEVRIVLNGTMRGSDLKNEETSTNQSNGFRDAQKESSDYKNYYYTINLSANYLYTFYKTKIGSAYCGVGPYLEYLITSNENERELNNYKSQNDEFHIGLITLAGIRGDLSKTISIFGEIQLLGGKLWRNSESTSYTQTVDSEFRYKSESSSNGWDYKLNLVTIGIRFSI